eukprot:4409073-Pleurochrysis_carterae.AAC.1
MALLCQRACLPTFKAVPAGRALPLDFACVRAGTRGDVQPFVALARGMAEQNNWLVTFATELRWRDFVLSKTRGLSAGAVRFRPTGGDTSARIEGWIARLFIESKMEMLQCMMLAWSEADFFSSGPAL